MCQNECVGNCQNREETRYQNRKPGLCVLLGPLECWCVIFGSWEQKITHPLFLSSSLPSAIFLASRCVVLSLPLIYHTYSGIWPQDAAGGAERCKVHFCPPVRACVGLWGGASQKHWDSSIVPLHSAQRAPVRRVFGRGWGGYGWGWGLSVTADCHRFSPASSRSVLPLVEPQGRQMHLPEIHTPGPDAYLPTPSPRFYINAACATHWCPFTLLRRAQRDIRLYSASLWNLEPSLNLQNF